MPRDPQEYDNIRCSLIDVETSGPGGASRQLASQLVQELDRLTPEPMVAYRGRQRWVQMFDSLLLEKDLSAHSCLQRGGVYLITGGLGGIGMAIAKRLARSVSARLVLVGRSTLPPREEWPAYRSRSDGNSGPARKIRDILELEQMGAETLVLGADVADFDQMADVVSRAEERFGTVNGVIHAAGVPGSGLMQLKTREAIDRVLRPKVLGTMVLHDLFRHRPLDLMVLFSSLTSIVGGGPGQLDYCAANAYLDAYAQAANRDDRRVVSIDWGEWQWDAWQDGLLGFDTKIQAFFQENRRRYGVSFDEGMEALNRILSQRAPQVVVSTRSFDTFMRLSKDFTLSMILSETGAGAESAPPHPRPVLGTSYVAPGNACEENIAAIWRDVLRIDQIGANDSFFELGGNSLLGLGLIAAMKKRMNIAIPMYAIYEAPSVASMAQFIARQNGHDGESSIDTSRSRGELRRQKRRTYAATVSARLGE